MVIPLVTGTTVQSFTVISKVPSWMVMGWSGLVEPFLVMVKFSIS